MTTRTDSQVDTPQELRRATRPGVSRPSRRRIWLRRAVVVILVPLLWLSWSIGSVLAAPGTDTTAARLAEWARFNGLGWVVSEAEQVQYQLNPPKVGGSLAGGIPVVSAPPVAPGPSVRTSPAVPHLAVLASIPPQAQPGLPNEGVWQTLTSVHGQPAIRAAFLRPDAQHTSYMVGVAWLNQKLVKMVLHPGYTVPGGSGWSQAFDVPSSQRNSLLATFNSGFTMQDANGGFWMNGKTAVPLRQGAASMVLYKDGHVDVVRWTAATPGPDVAAVRQNLGLLVSNGVISADVNSKTTRTWGKTVGDATFVWRSALGVRKDGSLVFVVGASMSVPSLAKIVHDAGAVTAMELDINKSWTNFITYTHPSSGGAVPHMLTKDEHPNPYRYLQLSSRDFVAVFPR
jgi:hypothetical protein